MKFLVKNKEVAPGKMLVYESNIVLSPKYIINFPTKVHWRSKSKMESTLNKA